MLESKVYPWQAATSQQARWQSRSERSRVGGAAAPPSRLLMAKVRYTEGLQYGLTEAVAVDEEVEPAVSEGVADAEEDRLEESVGDAVRLGVVEMVPTAIGWSQVMTTRPRELTVSREPAP